MLHFMLCWLALHLVFADPSCDMNESATASCSSGDELEQISDFQPVTTTTTSSHSSHYESHSSDSYENAYFSGDDSEYMDYLVRLTSDRLKLQAYNKVDRVILDVGGGTGNFAHALLSTSSAANSMASIVVVEPFLDPTNSTKLSTSDRVSFVKASAEDFLTAAGRQSMVNSDGRYDQLLLKEMVHHLKADERERIFRGMKDGIESDSSDLPSMLIITRPQIDIDYPLWEKAREVWKQNQPSEEDITEDLRRAGFTRVESTVESYPCTISLKRWQSMIRARFWSTFSHFTDEELEAACDEIARVNTDRDENGDGILYFEDRLIFITAW